MTWIRGRFVRFSSIVCICLCAFTASSLSSQDLPDVAQGLQPYVAYHGGELDQVNTYNGGLTVRIPLVSYPQRGSLSLSYSIVFNSFGFQDIADCTAAEGVTGPVATIPLHNGCVNTVQLIPTGIFHNLPVGPRLIADQVLLAGGVGAPQILQVVNPPTNGRFYVITADNAEHPLGLASDGTWRSIDGSSFMFAPSGAPGSTDDQLGTGELAYSGDETRIMTGAAGTITDSHGIVYTASGITDPDGNSIAISNAAPGQTGFYDGLPATDSTARTIPTPAEASGTSGCPTISQAANQPLASAMTWTPPGTDNGFLFCFASVTLNSSYWFKTSGTTQYPRPNAPPNSMLQSIVLPNGTYWGFVYDSSAGGETQTGSGQLMTLIYPTGGTVSYTYSMTNDGACTNLRESGLVPGSVFVFPAAVTSRTMIDAQGWSAVWNYTYPPSASGAFTGSILSPAGDLTVTKWGADNSGSDCGYVSAGQEVYQGNPSNPATATPLKSTTLNYTGTPAFGPPYVSTARILSETTVLNGTSTSSVQYGYAPGVNVAVASCNPDYESCVAADASPVFIGAEASKTYTDYTGAVLKQDTTTYQWQSSPAYFTANLVSIPYQTQTLDAAGSLHAQTTYAYDESTYSSGGTKGHPTTVTKWLNTNSSASPITHTGWNSNGEKSFFIDANGNKNSYGHTIDYQYGSASCNGSEVTDTYDALNDHISGSYDCSSGRLTSYIDANSNTTQINYDGLGRITTVTYPSIPIWTGQAATPATTFNYEDSSNQVVRTITATPDPTQSTTVTFDGFGREIHRYTAATPSQVTVDTTYDSDGRIYSVSNPYYSTGDATYGLTVYNYDALNRKTKQTQPDGTSTLQWLYSGNVVTAEDELGHNTQQTSDSLGRLTLVMEPDPTTGTLDLQTSYSYDPLSNLVSVDQAGNASANDVPRYRSFNYDSLSHLLTSLNPESGWICYGTTGGAAPSGTNCASGYDANGNLLYKTDARIVTTAYSYDALNRLISKSYQNDPSGTPSSCFQYGLPATASSGANQITRLMSEWTQKVSAGSCPGILPSTGYLTLKAILQYDAMGHIDSESQCAPSGCSSGVPYSMSYGYDLAGNLAFSNNGILTTPGMTSPLTFTTSYDAASRLLSVSSSRNDSLHPPSIFSAQDYAAPGELMSATFGNGITLSRTYNSRLWVTGESDTGDLILNATPGTATLTITGAEQSH
jgi:YD repeat-containing protein